MSDLFLLFRIGTHRFAMPASEIVEVLPALDWSPLPQLPAPIAGVFTYRGQPVPAVDLSQLVAGKPVELRMSTRIVLVKDQRHERLLGLIAENVTEIFRTDFEMFKDSGVGTPAPYLGKVMERPDGILQHFDLQRLLKSEFIANLPSFENNACN